MKTRALTILLMLAPLAACSSSLGGHVYVDSNVNGTIDVGEKGVANMHYTVTVDGAKLTDGYTLKDGSYSIPIKSTGKVCVTLDKSYMQGVVPKGLNKPTLGESVLPPPANAVEDPYNKSQQKSVSVVKGTVTDSSTQVSDPAKTTTPPPADPYAPKQPAEGTKTISDQSGCVQMGAGNQDMDIPIKVDYNASFDSIATPQEITIAPCDTFDWKWVWASECTPMSVTIPEAFFPAANEKEVGMQGDASTSPVLDLSIGVTPDSTMQPTNLTQDSLSTRIVHMQVKCNLTGDKQSYSLQAKMLCPDGSTLLPPPLKVTVNTQPSVTVQPSLPSGSPKLTDWGGTSEADFTVTNNNAQVYTAVVLTIKSTSNMTMQPQTPDGMTCNNLGQTLVCTFKLDKQGTSGGTVVLKVPFTLPTQPKSLVDPLNYTLSSSLALPNQSTAITGSDITFSLSPN